MAETQYRTCEICDSVTEHAALRGLVDIASRSTEYECLDCGHRLDVDW